MKQVDKKISSAEEDLIDRAIKLVVIIHISYTFYKSNTLVVFVT